MGTPFYKYKKESKEEKPLSSIEEYEQLNKKLILKYVLDRLCACILLAIASPIILFGSFIIKLQGWFYPEEAGSIFYTEPRISAGKVFRIIKFRTITEKAVVQIREKQETKSITGSLGITRAGKFILNWYLDELPQLFNIAKGDMSFVGPRPHIVAQHNQEIKVGLLYRNVIKAGLLGIPQACKRRPKYASLLKKMERTHKPYSRALNTLDGLYAKKCMRKKPIEILFFDISIIFQGLVVVSRGTK